jgi:hypothetical protein
LLTRTRILLLALLALAAVAVAPTAGAQPPVRSTFELPELELFDLSTSTVCGADVFANVSGTVERRLYFDRDGAVTHQIENFQGRITWFTRGTGKSYSSAIVNKVRIDFPEGADLFKPVRISVTGLHGGVFPLFIDNGGSGPAGSGTLVYDGFMYAQDDEGFVYWAAEGAPVSMSGNFEGAARRICNAVA